MKELFIVLFLAASAQAASIEQVCERGFPVSGTLSSTLTDTTSTSLIAAQGTNVRVYLTDVTVTNSDASVGTVVKIMTGSTVKERNYAAAAGGGWHSKHGLKGDKNTAWNIQAETTSAELTATVSGCAVYEP